MLIHICVEILILWCLFAVYMAILVGGKGSIGGIQFYPKEVQERVLELGMITKEQLKKTTVYFRITACVFGCCNLISNDSFCQ